jgi:hypothetical protein
MSNNLNLSQVAAAQNQKEVTINDQAGQLDAALTEQFDADVSASNVALTAEQYRRAIHIKATGAATAGRTVTLQAIKKLSIISNFSTTDSVDFVLGSATITLDPAADAANPTMALVYTDGTADGLYQVSSGVGGGGGAESYDFGFTFGAEPNASTVIQRVQLSRAIEVPANMAGSTGSVDTNPTSTYDIDVQDDGVSIGTISISTGGAFTFTTAGGTAKSIVAGSVITFVSPGSPDGTVAGVAVGIVATEA